MVFPPIATIACAEKKDTIRYRSISRTSLPLHQQRCFYGPCVGNAWVPSVFIWSSGRSAMIGSSPVIPETRHSHRVKGASSNRRGLQRRPAILHERTPAAAPMSNYTPVKISRWQRFLPAIIGWVAFLVYSATLCRGISLNNLPLTAALAGWHATPVTGQPVLWLVTAPFHWCHGMKDKAQLSWVFGVAWATMVKPGSLGFAEDSLSRKMAWPCD